MKFFHDKIVDNEILYNYTNLNKITYTLITKTLRNLT